MVTIHEMRRKSIHRVNIYELDKNGIYIWPMSYSMLCCLYVSCTYVGWFWWWGIGVDVGQFITFGFACTPLYFVWEKAIGMHECKSLCKRAAARLPVVIPIWFLAIVFPFFGPINSTVGSLLVSFTVYIIPALAHMFTFKSATAREVSLVSLLSSFIYCPGLSRIGE